MKHIKSFESFDFLKNIFKKKEKENSQKLEEEYQKSLID